MVLFFSHASPGINICIDIHRDDVISIMYKDCTKSKWSLYPTKFVNCEKLAIVAARNSWKCKISSTQIRVPGIPSATKSKAFAPNTSPGPPYHLDCMEVPPDDLHHRHREAHNLTPKWIRIRPLFPHVLIWLGYLGSSWYLHICEGSYFDPCPSYLLKHWKPQSYKWILHTMPQVTQHRRQRCQACCDGMAPMARYQSDFTCNMWNHMKSYWII